MSGTIWRARLLAAVTAATCWATAFPAVAAPPGQKTGGKATASKPAKPALPKPAHQKGPAPKKPSATLPQGAPRSASDVEARRGVVDGPLAEELRQRISDPELSALRDAERVLFPRTLTGFQSGWSWGDVNPSAQQQGLPPVVQALPSATREDAALTEWMRSLALPDFPVTFDAHVVKYLKFYRDTQNGQAIARTWARKLGRYTAAMQAELAKAGLPKDLVWVSLIESGHNPTAVSPAGAAGIWQFMPESGRMYGLTVDRWVDERLDPQRATQAAAQYLSDLYQRFGTWELALAAYNMGQGALLKSVRKYNTNDFWKLGRYEAGLPWETSLYVPKIFAIVLVMNNKRAFGLDDVEPDPAISFDTVYVGSAVALEDVARASGIPVESLRSMNPQYSSGRTPPAAQTEKPESKSEPARWAIKVPRGTGAATSATLAKQAQKPAQRTTVVRFGETLEALCQRWQVSDKELTAFNGLKPGERLVPGSVLLLPGGAKTPLPDTEELVVIPAQALHVPGRKRVFYKVLQGDTLAGVANALSVTADELVLWNDLVRSAKLQSGMTLQAYVTPNADLSSVRHVTADSTRVMEAGTESFIDYFESQNGRKRLRVTVKQGDTLASIGARYGLSVGMMERINHLPRSGPLKPGDQVIVYAKQDQKSGSDGKPTPLAQVNPPRPDVLPALR